MSANYVVDLNATTLHQVSVGGDPGVAQSVSSGLQNGNQVDAMHANTFTNVFVAIGDGADGNAFDVQIQTTATSGASWSDPTSGLTQFPDNFQSGGIMHVNSGGTLSGGGIQFGAFLSPHRYKRLLILSGSSADCHAIGGFISQKKTVGSGGGFTFLPGSGTVSV